MSVWLSHFVRTPDSLNLATHKKGHRSIEIREGDGFQNWLNTKSKGVWIQFILEKKADHSFLSGSRCPWISGLTKPQFCFGTFSAVILFSWSWEGAAADLFLILTFINIAVLILPLILLILGKYWGLYLATLKKIKKREVSIGLPSNLGGTGQNVFFPCEATAMGYDKRGTSGAGDILTGPGWSTGGNPIKSNGNVCATENGTGIPQVYSGLCVDQHIRKLHWTIIQLPIGNMGKDLKRMEMWPCRWKGPFPRHTNHTLHLLLQTAAASPWYMLQLHSAKPQTINGPGAISHTTAKAFMFVLSSRLSALKLPNIQTTEQAWGGKKILGSDRITSFHTCMLQEESFYKVFTLKSLNKM